MSTYDEILEHVKTLEIIDTHTHLLSNEEKWVESSWRQLIFPGKWDVLKEYLSHYLSSDLVSAGLPMASLEKIRTSDLPIVEKWDLVEEHWQYARHTGYARAVDIAARDIYGIPGISRNTIEELNSKFLESIKPGHYKRVLKDLSNIQVGLLDGIPALEGGEITCDPAFFKPVYNTVSLVMPESQENIYDLEAKTGIRVTSFDAYLKCCKVSLDRELAAGAVGLKSDIAYKRSLLFERTTRSLAEAEFNEFLNDLPRDQTMFSKRPVLGPNAQNYIMHYILELANERQLVYQIHTGLQEGSGNYIAWSDPTLLSNVFLQYPDVRFALFHIAYPFQHMLSALAKNFPNVYIDMSWAHVISPEACTRALIEWLDSVPYNKICGFGGDYVILDAVYGHRVLALENISRALAYKVEEKRFDIDCAKKIAGSILKDNAVNLYRLEY